MANLDNKGGIFSSVLKKKQRRSNFNLSHDVKLSLDMGNIVPTYIQECVPGDNITIRTSSMLRMAPLVSPVMHKVDVKQEFFFVPNRILWANWETFITGARNGKQLTADEMPAFPLVAPYDAINGLPHGNGSLADYLGLPTDASFPAGEEPTFAFPVSALPFAAYQRIYDEYYRDENLIESIYDEDLAPWENYNMLQDGLQDEIIQQQLGQLKKRAWEHDYFTSALPWAQKGEAVQIPIDLNFDAEGIDEATKLLDTGGNAATDDHLMINSTGDPDEYWPIADNANRSRFNIDNTAGIQNSSTINDLRAAIKLQEWLETNARGGSRYFESIYAHFGLQTPDSRLQRPEFIGSTRSNMVISEVLQTSSPQGELDTPQGNMSGHGQSVNQSKKFKYFCQEHGFIIGMISVIPRTAYQQGIEKHWLKTQDRLDYYFPEFAHLGEQPIQNFELYAGGNFLESPQTFGYTPRYAEYKFINSRVAGDFRTNLKYWHLGRIFDDGPALNGDFVTANPSKRIFAVQNLPNDGDETTSSIRNYHSIYAHVFHDVKANRLMPKYGTPTL